MRAITRIVGAGAATVLALSLAACSSDDGSSDDETKAADASTSAPATDEKGSDEGEELSGAEIYDALASALSEDTSYRSTVTTSSGSVTSTTNLEVVVTGGATNMSMVMDAAGAESRVLLVDGAYYMDLGEASQNKFLKIDGDDESSPFAGMFTALEQLTDPAKNAEAFKSAVTSAKKIGEEDVDGVKATHYTLTIDGSAALEELGAGASAAPDGGSMEFELWLDGEDRPVRTISTFAGTSTETTYTDWGDSSITVEAPSADEISPLTWEELMSGAGSLGG